MFHPGLTEVPTLRVTNSTVVMWVGRLSVVGVGVSWMWVKVRVKVVVFIFPPRILHGTCPPSDDYFRSSLDGSWREPLDVSMGRFKFKVYLLLIKPV